MNSPFGKREHTAQVFGDLVPDILHLACAHICVQGLHNSVEHFDGADRLYAEALAQLTPREERILRMRFGIGMADHTLEQVGKTFGVTRERIRQIEAKALQKLGHPAKASKLVSFLEG